MAVKLSSDFNNQCRVMVQDNVYHHYPTPHDNCVIVCGMENVTGYGHTVKTGTREECEEYAAEYCTKCHE